MTLSISVSRAECDYAESRVFYCYAECQYAECRNAECRGAMLQLLAYLNVLNIQRKVLKIKSY